jgi:hypothetical protein
MIASTESKRPLDVAILSISFWILGGIGFFLAPIVTVIYLQEPSVQNLSYATTRTTMGLLMALAGVGLWRMRRWWVLPYGMFVGVRLATRFLETFTGSITLDVVSHVLSSVATAVLGLSMMRSIEQALAHQQLDSEPGGS